MRNFLILLALFTISANVFGLEQKSKTDNINTTALVKSFLELASFRQEVLARNIANLNTPNYKAEDVNMPTKYEHLTQGKSMSARLKLRKTNTSHASGLSKNNSKRNFVSHKIKDSPEEKPNGNNVSLSQQMFKASKTQQDYNEALKTYVTTTNLVNAMLGK